MHLYAFSSLACYITPSLVVLAHLLLFFLDMPHFPYCLLLLPLSFSTTQFFTMEILLPVKTPVSCSRTASYRLETKNLSYNLCSDFDQLTNWIFCGWSPRGACKSILKNVNCEARPGDITAIAGPSGAGKTTLLEILAGKISPIPEVSNQVLVNNQSMDAKLFRKLSGFVSQDDALFALLTVQETLLYSALLRLPVGQKEAVNRVKRLMNDLGLDHIADSRIGDGSNSGISGGERRRVSIGVELVHDPAVVFIDEPTSGLDSASALHVVTLLKSMVVNQGKTIVITIHQPGFRILEMIDRIILLSNGSVVHNGSLNCVEDRLKLSGHRIPLHVNVLEFSIDVIETLGVQQDSESFNNPSREIRNNEHLATRNPEKMCCYANSVLEEVSILGRRFCSNIFRTKQLFATRIIQASVVGFLLGSIFFKVGTETGQAALQARIGFFAFSLTFLLSSTTEGLPIFLQERRILMRETSRGAYRVSSYVLSNTLIFLPFLLLVGLLFSTPVYWLAGLRRDVGGFLYFSLVVWMVVSMANSFVACFSALVPNFIMGNSVIAGMMGSFFLFSGYFLSKKDIPDYWIFMHYLSLFKYPFECFLINEYGGEKGNRICLEYGNIGECSLDGSGFLRQQELEESLKWSNLAIMLGFIVGYRVLSFLILWLRRYKSR